MRPHMTSHDDLTTAVCVRQFTPKIRNLYYEIWYPMGPPEVAAGIAERHVVRSMSASERKLADGEGRPRIIWMAVEIQRLWDMDAKSESFSFSGLVKMRWRCPNMHARSAMEQGGDTDDLGVRGAGLITSWAPDWHPRLKVWNTVTELTERRHHYLAHKPDPNEEAVWITRWTECSFTISQTFALATYPFDVQSIQLRIEVENVLEVRPLYDAHRTHPVRAMLSTVGSLPEYEVLTDRHDGQPAAFFKFLRNELIVSINYERLWAFHVYNVYALLTIISACSAVVWVLDPEEHVNDRLNIGVTLLLVAIAFKQGTSSLLPNVSYLTLIDHFALGVIVQIVAALTFTAITGAVLLGADGRMEGHVRQWDWWLLIVWVMASLLWNGKHVLYAREQVRHNHKRYDSKRIMERGFARMELSDAEISDARAGLQGTDLRRLLPHDVGPRAVNSAILAAGLYRDGGQLLAWLKERCCDRSSAARGHDDGAHRAAQQAAGASDSSGADGVTYTALDEVEDAPPAPAAHRKLMSAPYEA